MRQLAVRESNSHTRSTLTGLGVGALVGATIGVLAGPSLNSPQHNPRSAIEFSDHDMRVLGGVLFGCIGGALGGFVGYNRATRWRGVPLSIGAGPGAVSLTLSF